MQFGNPKIVPLFETQYIFPCFAYLNRLYIYSDLKCSWIGRSVNGIFNRSEWRMTPFPHCTAWFFRNQFVYLSITPSTQPFVMIVGGCPTLYISGTIIIHFDWESCSSPTSYVFADWLVISHHMWPYPQWFIVFPIIYPQHLPNHDFPSITNIAHESYFNLAYPHQIHSISPCFSPGFLHVFPSNLRWLSQKEALEEVPKTIPASAAYLSTRAGLLFNEMQYSPEPVLRGAWGTLGVWGWGWWWGFGWWLAWSRAIHIALTWFLPRSLGRMMGC